MIAPMSPAVVYVQCHHWTNFGRRCRRRCPSSQLGLCLRHLGDVMREILDAHKIVDERDERREALLRGLGASVDWALAAPEPPVGRSAVRSGTVGRAGAPALDPGAVASDLVDALPEPMRPTLSDGPREATPRSRRLRASALPPPIDAVPAAVGGPGATTATSSDPLDRPLTTSERERYESDLAEWARMTGRAWVDGAA